MAWLFNNAASFIELSINVKLKFKRRRKANTLEMLLKDIEMITMN